jgi:hypothetical protein
MDNKINTWLYDILNSIEEIESFFETKPLNFLEYQKDIKTKRAVERNIEIISLRGETEFLSSITSTAEHTWALLLCLVRQLVPVYENVVFGKWERTPFPLHQLSGMTLGIIGYGRLGKIIANYAPGMKNIVFITFLVQSISHPT